jgi:hypothetical protein
MELSSFSFLLVLMFAHLVADFFMQSREMGRNKSKKPGWLLRHVGIHVAVFATFVYIALAASLGGTSAPHSVLLLTSLIFAAINGVFHGVVDLTTWNLYALSVKYRAKHGHIPYDRDPVKFRYWEDHWFYVTIGVDQFLHVAHILLVYRMFYDI